jgi:ATP adenylyltransferase
MTDDSTERSRNLWAPWRMQYIDTLHAPQADGCFLCRYRDNPSDDQTNLVLWRGKHNMAVLNRFPYAGGHSMIAPLRHVADLSEMSDDEMLELTQMLRDTQRVLAEAVRAEGFNIGINIGRCAGAGLPGHLHMHVVPRWPGDVNFITVLGDVRVIPETLGALWTLLRQTAERLNLPAAGR